MRIIPKIGEFDVDFLDNYLDIVDKSLEIQLLSKKFMDSVNNIEKICTYYNTLDYVILHLPFNCVNICHIHSSYKIELDFIMFIVKIMELGRNLNINFDILFHIDKTGESFEEAGGIVFLDYICNLVKNSNVSFLLENSIRDINIRLGDIDNVSYIFKKIKDLKLGFCLDICHLQASENAYQTKFELSSDCLSALKNIHFSKTLNNDGYRNKKETHGRGHVDKFDVVKDLKYLEEKGILLDDMNIVLEISEEDYVNRPDLKREVLIFKELMTDE